MIVYSHPISQHDLTLLEGYGKEHKTPLVAVHSAGFYSYFQTRMPGTFPVVDTHPDETATTDLRLLAPWPELVEFSNKLTADIDTLDSHEHGHLPYISILLHYLERWREAHDGKDPTTYREKLAFRRTVANGARQKNPEGEENFEEAVSAVLRNIVKPSIRSSVREVFAHEPKDSVGIASIYIILLIALALLSDLQPFRNGSRDSGLLPMQSNCSATSTMSCHCPEKFPT